MKILFGGGVRSPMVEMKCIDNLISSLISSYLRLKEDLSLDDQLDSGEQLLPRCLLSKKNYWTFLCSLDLCFQFKKIIE